MFETLENKNTNSEEQNMEKIRTKQEAQEDLFERFKMSTTSDFQEALMEGRIEEAEEWLRHIVDNQDDFPQYQATWDSWLADRKTEIEMTKDNPDKKWGASRSKRKAQEDLFDRFEMSKTSDFQKALREGHIEEAEEWLRHIIDNKDDFPQYHATWNSWLADRKAEIKEAKEGKK